jgi:hypothetical protein
MAKRNGIELCRKALKSIITRQSMFLAKILFRQVLISYLIIIYGQNVNSTAHRFGEIGDPATGKVTSLVPLANNGEVEQGILAAEEAQPAWSARPQYVVHE